MSTLGAEWEMGALCNIPLVFSIQIVERDVMQRIIENSQVLALAFDPTCFRAIFFLMFRHLTSVVELLGFLKGCWRSALKRSWHWLSGIRLQLSVFVLASFCPPWSVNKHVLTCFDYTVFFSVNYGVDPPCID